MITIEDIQALGYATLMGDNDTYHISGFGIDVSISRGDQVALDSIGNIPDHTERKFQYEQSNASKAREMIIDKGYTVTRPDTATDLFDLKDGITTVLAAQTPAQLVTQANSLPLVGGTATESSIKSTLSSRLVTLAQARDALDAGTLFTNLGVNEKALIRLLIRDDMSLIRLALNRFEALE